MASYVTPKKNAAYRFDIGLVDQSNTKLLKVNPTIAAGDFKVSTDHSAFANLVTLPSVNPAGGRSVMIDLSAAEMNGDNIIVQCVDAAGSEWCDLLINIQTTVSQIDDLALATVAAAIKAKTDLVVQGLQKNVAFSNFHIFMVNSGDHVNGIAGITITGQRAKDGGPITNIDNAVGEIGQGLYKVDLTANDLNADIITLGFNGPGADTRTITIITKP